MAIVSYSSLSEDTTNTIHIEQNAATKHAEEAAFLVSRPTLDYQHLFDLCALHTYAASGPVGIIAQREHDKAELVKRLVGLPPSQVDGANAGSFAPKDEDAPIRFRTLIWIAATTSTTSDHITQLCQMLTDDGQLLVVCSGYMAHVLRRSTIGANAYRVQRSLQRTGLTVEMSVGFHGLASFVWGIRSIVAARLKRDDLADRYHFRMRATYVVEGWQAFFAPLVVLQARRSEHS